MNRQALLAAFLFLILAGAAVVGVLVWRQSGNASTASAAATTTTTSDALDAPRPPTSRAGQERTTTTTGTGSPGYVPVLEDARCDFDLFTEMEFRCGYVVVPENRDDPGNGREVRLHFAIFETDNPDDPPDPIVYLDGGPGGETLDALQFSLVPVWSDFIAERDMVFFDQRGTGRSEPSLKCGETRELFLDVLDDDLDPQEYVAAELDALTRCRERLVNAGIDLDQYNSAANAADVADLRLALGYDEWNLLGISYGTRLAETVMRDHPEGVRSVVLDSTYTPDVDLISSAPDNFQRALDVFFEACASDTECAASYPDLETRLFDVIATLDADPVAAEITDFLEGETYGAIMDGQFLLNTIFSGLYSEGIIPLLPQVIAEMEERDTSTIELLASNDLAQGAFFSYGMHASVQCNEEVPFVDEQTVSRESQQDERLIDFFITASNIGPSVFDICDVWDVAAAAPVENEPVVSDIPTLVLAGVHDPITPPQWGERAAATLDNATYLEFPGVGHGVSVSGECPRNITLDFIEAPDTPPDTSCIAEMGGPDWVIPGEAAPPVVLSDFEEPVFGVTITGVVPEGWEAVGPGSWTRGETFVDQTAIVQQAVPGTLEPELFAGLVGSQIGFDGDPRVDGTLEAGDRIWTLFSGELGGFPVHMAIGNDGSTTGIVVLVADEEDRSQLYDEVFVPALEAFRTG